MFNERAFIAKVETAAPEALAEILTRPSLEEEKALRAHLGEERYQRMHSLALKRKVSRSVRAQSKGNVVVIHGIMGAELSVSSGGPGDLTWVSIFRIVRGWLDRLRLSDDGKSDANSKFSVRATSIMNRYYGELILSLGQEWNVKPFWFDWRKDLDLAADELNTVIESFAGGAPVHIVAHSMGGLVARTFIKKYKDRWTKMWDKSGKGRAGGRLVMLGTPNMGSFAIPQVITGLEGLVRKLAIVDLRHNVSELLPTFNSFVGSYQMLPSSLAMPSITKLYDAETYKPFGAGASQTHLDNARDHHKWLADVIDADRMIYIAGYDQPTFSDIADWTRLDKVEGYKLTRDGDGRVPHALGLFTQPDGTPKVLTYFIKEEHGNLSSNDRILRALSGLLETGATAELPEKPEKSRAAKQTQQSLREEYKAKEEKEEELLKASRDRIGRTAVPGSLAEDRAVEIVAPALVSPEERKAEEAITRGFLPYRSSVAVEDIELQAFDEYEPSSIEIGLTFGGIESIRYEAIKTSSGNPIDVVAVGHYIGVQPQYAELQLDRAISAALLGKKYGPHFKPQKSDLILTQYTERGVIQGNLGQPFLIPDPRVRKGQKERLIAVAGMDEAGGFGMPELTVLARELCWTLGRLNKVHLATVMIGAGEGNLALRDAVSGWLSGIRRAVTNSQYDKYRRLERVTFVEKDPRRVIQLDELLLEEAERQKDPFFKITYRKLTGKEQSALKEQAYQAARRDLERKWGGGKSPLDPPPEPIPARATLNLDVAKKTYRFGAITDTASVPEREVPIDPSLVWQANDELAGEQSAVMQLERGRFLEQLLMPQDLRKQLYSNAPLVMILDATTARIHWEMVAQPSLGSDTGSPDADQLNDESFENGFLGTSRGFTRQLRTTFAPTPEPPPPPQRVLRVLVVADPAEDAHLPGAQEEGVMVADLFESYNVVDRDKLKTRVEVKRLFGPIEATRTNVLKELMLRSYDVLHFAGHCAYKLNDDPNLSGWIFNMERMELLSANELNRVDRIPKFVFSNACESGITPDRAQERNAELAPGFAEAFFARGVANFVCTAWPVDDVASRDFALTLYSGLLGITQGTKPEPSPVLSMHAAMRQARLAIARTSNGRTTWGAYQHYGNPYFQFFYSKSLAVEEKVGPRARAKRRTQKRKTTKKGKAGR